MHPPNPDFFDEYQMLQKSFVANIRFSMKLLSQISEAPFKSFVANVRFSVKLLRQKIRCSMLARFLEEAQFHQSVLMAAPHKRRTIPVSTNLRPKS